MLMIGYWDDHSGAFRKLNDLTNPSQVDQREYKKTTFFKLSLIQIFQALELITGIG